MEAAAPSLRQYVRKLEGAGARVVVTPDILGDCVLQAQVARMYTWQYSFVQPEDTVILGDADMFIVGRDVLSMLEIPSRAWFGEYVHTEVGGGTVPMALAAMRAEDWRAGLDFSPTGGPVGLEDVVRHYQGWNGDSDFGKWSIDQVILSFVVLRPDRQLCSLPAANQLWQRLQLEPRTFDDTGLCYHGNLMNCFIQEHRTHCPWWHFVPSDREQQFKKVYKDIVEKGAVQLAEGRPFFFNAHLGYTGPPCYALPCQGDPEPEGP